MTHLEVQHKADIFKRQIIQRSASLFSNPILVLKGFLTSFPISTSRPWSHFSLCDRRFAPGLEFPNSRILPYSFIYCWGFPTLFHPFTTICSPCSVIFFFTLWSELFPFFLATFLFQYKSLHSFVCFVLFLLCRRQNLSPEALRSSVSKMYVYQVRNVHMNWDGHTWRKRG